MTESDRLVRHEGVIRNTARIFFLHGADHDDVLQEARIAALVAIRSFEAGRGMREESWVQFCVHRRLVTLLKRGKSEGRRSFAERRSLEDLAADSDSVVVGDTLVSTAPSPERHAIARDELARLSRVGGSPLERSVLPYLLSEAPYEDVAADLGVSYKSVDNTVQRLRRKARRCLEAA